MPKHFTLSRSSATLAAALSIAGALAGCQSKDFMRISAAPQTLFDVQLEAGAPAYAEPVLPLDATPITPMETVGAPADRG